ncbi:MAG: ABC transporter ATP-binding protein [Zavarzinella sp.]
MSQRTTTEIDLDEVMTARTRYAWGAHLAGVLAALCLVVLVATLYLFVDLLADRGVSAKYRDLRVADQDKVLAQWEQIPAERRAEIAKALGLIEQEAANSTFHLVVQPECTPPARMEDSEQIRQWAEKHQQYGDVVSIAENILQYRMDGVFYQHMATKVNLVAAERFAATIYVREQELSFDHHAILTLASHHHDRTAGWLALKMAKWFPWTWNGSPANEKYLTGLLFCATTVVVFGLIFQLLGNFLAARAASSAAYELRQAVYAHTERQSSLNIAAHRLDQAVRVFNREIDQFKAGLSYRYSHDAYSITKVVLLTALALGIHPWMTIAFLAFSIMVGIVGWLLRQAAQQQARDSRRTMLKLQSILTETLVQIRLVKAYLMEKFNEDRLERQLQDYQRAEQTQNRPIHIYRPFLLSIGLLGLITMAYLGGRVLLNEGLTLAGFAVLCVCLGAVFLPIRALFAGRKVLREAAAARTHLEEYLSQRDEIETYPEAEYFAGLTGSIEFDEVTVKHPEADRKILARLRAEIPAGGITGIVASNVEEQVALVYLLQRFIDPDAGEIRFNGRNYHWYTVESLRAQVGVVLQNALVINDTVFNNISGGDPGYGEQQIMAAAKIAHAHHFIQHLPQGYQTPIGQLGHYLSTGQKFRIALARAILRDPSVYVIEEPADMLDEETSQFLRDTYARIARGKTIIFLPHRMQTIRDCDQILLLHHGKIEAKGSHRDLISNNELYRHLYYLEFNPFADQAAVATDAT